MFECCVCVCLILVKKAEKRKLQLQRQKKWTTTTKREKNNSLVPETLSTHTHTLNTLLTILKLYTYKTEKNRITES